MTFGEGTGPSGDIPYVAFAEKDFAGAEDILRITGGAMARARHTTTGCPRPLHLRMGIVSHTPGPACGFHIAGVVVLV